MTYSVGEATPFADNVIWPGGMASLGSGAYPSLNTSPVSNAWPTAAKAIYIPFVLQSSATVYQVGWTNGATVAGTTEVGVYDAGGTKIVTGSATQATINVLQFVNVTDTLLGPGQYWLAGMNSSTGTLTANTPVAPSCATMGILTQTSANPLPATATFALDNVLAYIPMIFLQMRSVM